MAAARKLLRGIVPAWVVGAAGVALLLVLYAGLLFALNGRSDPVFDELAALPPTGAVTLARVAPPPPVIVMRGDRLRRFLEPEIREGLVTVAEDAQQIVVTIRGAGMFDSASPTVKSQFEPLLRRIGEALNDQPGAVLLTGHTDADADPVAGLPVELSPVARPRQIGRRDHHLEDERARARAGRRPGQHRAGGVERHAGGPPAEPPDRNHHQQVDE